MKKYDIYDLKKHSAKLAHVSSIVSSHSSQDEANEETEMPEYLKIKIEQMKAAREETSSQHKNKQAS